jgi:hypothetical protein
MFENKVKDASGRYCYQPDDSTKRIVNPERDSDASEGSYHLKYRVYRDRVEHNVWDIVSGWTNKLGLGEPTEPNGVALHNKTIWSSQ